MTLETAINGDDGTFTVTITDNENNAVYQPMEIKEDGIYEFDQKLSDIYLSANSTASNSEKLEDKTKAEVISEAREGLAEKDEDVSFKNAIFDNGQSTTVIISADSSGMGTLNVCANDQTSQSTGRVYVGQSLINGGGIEYNGDNSPSTTGAGADYVVLFRSNGGQLDWTARNQVGVNNWEFRSEVKAQRFREGDDLLSDKYALKTEFDQLKQDFEALQLQVNGQP